MDAGNGEERRSGCACRTDGRASGAGGTAVLSAGASAVAGAITPVPGGVGPMTIAVLLRNTLVAAHRNAGVALEDQAL